ncbi:MAG: hypothetical protein CVV24_05115 [Ignavibacteriae bacterium HGW-Ignavibacteriae-3]|nr:MAG: hypothetical protein CVV24_05115 [Ignavibacteriae bacterium HGW-Ignavibacteriae-3]
MLNYRYEIVSQIGEGRSRVFLCHDELLQSRIALKVLSGNAPEQEKKDFYNEYLLLSRFNHPLIIKAFEYGIILAANDSDTENFLIGKNDAFFSMEHFEGETLDKSLDTVDPDKLYFLIDSISSVLFYLHQSNFIYYDLKPENILLRNVENSPELKIVDFGFASHMMNKKGRNILGSLKYIAPEILNQEARNQQADLYSLGVLLYRMLFKKFPFDSEIAMEIYKAQIEGEINYPEIPISSELLKAIKKLLQKYSYNRYVNTLFLLGDLGIPLSENYRGAWDFPRVYSGRSELIKLLNTYIVDSNDCTPYKINGASNSGKSFLLDELNSKYGNSILVTSRDFRPGLPPDYQLLKLISFNEVVFNQIPIELKDEILGYLASDVHISTTEYRKLFSKISETAKFILLFDDILKFEPIVLDLISNIVPVFIVNSIKIIYTENSSSEIDTKIFANSHAIDLKPFLEAEVLEFLQKNFAHFFPQKEIYDLILKYSDLQPGSIAAFIRNLVSNNILVFDGKEGIRVNMGSPSIKLMKMSMEENHSSLFTSLNTDERKVLDYLSSIKNPVGEAQITEITGFSETAIQSVLKSLEKKNIIKMYHGGKTFEIQSRSFADYICANTEKGDQVHREIAKWMSSSKGNGGFSEIAYHLEKAGHYSECYSYYYKEIGKARELSAYNYAAGILNHLLTLPLEKSKIVRVKTDLSELYYLIGNFQLSQSFILELLEEPLAEKDRRMFMVQNGLVMIQMGSSREGIDLLESLVEQINDENKKHEIIASIADAYLYLNDFEKARGLCGNLVSCNEAGTLIKGKAFTLLGLIELYEKNNPAAAIENINCALNLYETEKMTQQISAAKINIGNLYVMLGDYESAKSNWNEALALNKSIGNLEQEANLLLNYGVLYYDLSDFEIAVDRYKRAKIIFESLGDRHALGLTLMNLAEVHYVMCNYSEVTALLTQASMIFLEMENMMEYAEVLFITGKFRYTLRDADSLRKTVLQLNEFAKMSILTESHLMKLNLLKGLLCYLENRSSDAVEILRESVRDFSGLDERDNNYNYSFACFQLVNVFLATGKYDAIGEILNEPRLREVAGKNIMISIEREYWIARLLIVSHEKSAYDKIESALEKLQGISIINLSWQVSFLSGLYFEKRGNIKKAEKYFYLTNALISEITERISGIELRELFSNHIDVKGSLDYIKAFSDRIPPDDSF